MYGHEILKWFDSQPVFKDHLFGVCTWTSVPKFQDNTYCIINTATDPSKTGHWLVCGQRNSTIEYFDSLGCSSRAQEFVIETCKDWPSFFFAYNTNRYQPLDSNHCGQFAIYFLFNRLMNIDLSLEEVLGRIFVKTPEANERLVLNFMREHVGQKWQ